MFVLNILFIQAQEISHQVTQLSDGSHQIDYFDGNGKLLNAWLYLGDIDGYEFDTYQNEQAGDNIESFGDDYFEETVWLPDENGGARPLDVCYNPFHNKYYIYGGKRLIIVNGENNEVIKAVTVSNGGFINIFFSGYPIMPFQKRLVYNSQNHNIYCVAHGGEIIEIDGNTDETNVIYIEEELSVDPSHFIYYHPITNKIYALIRTKYDLEDEKLIVYNCNTGSVEKMETIGRINDLEMNVSGTLIFTTSSSGFKAYNESDLSVVANVSIPNLGKIGYSDLGKIYCDPINSNDLLYCLEDEYIFQPITLTSLSEIKNSVFISGAGVNKIFVSGGDRASFIDCNTNQEVNTYTLKKSIGITYGQNNLLYCSGKSNNEEYILKSFDVVDGSIVSEELNSYGIGYRLDYNSINSEVLSANFREGYMGVFNADCTQEKIWHTGGGYSAGCYNKDRSKLFFLQKSYGIPIETDQEKYNSHVIIYDIEDNETESIELGSKLTDIVFNEENNKIVVTSYGNNSVFIINAYDYSDIDEITGISKPYSIESGSDDLVYIGCIDQIYFLDITSLILSDPFSIPGGSGAAIIFDLVYDNDLERLYVGGGYNVTTVDVQDVNNPVIINVADIFGSKYYMQIIKTDQGVNNVIMGAGTTDFVVLNANNFEYIISDVLGSKICYSSFERKIYSFHTDNTVNVFNVNGDYLSEIQTPYDISHIVYNPNNNSIYCAGLLNEELAISTIECRSDEVISTVLLPEKDATLSGPLGNTNLMAGTLDNKIINVNGYLSNASIIQAQTDNLQIGYGWRWISFPRMQRFENETELTASVLPRIDVFPIELHIEYSDKNDEQYEMNYYLIQGWLGELTDLKSTYGYKFRIDQGDGLPPNIDLHGAVLDPATEVSIYADQYPGQGLENWMGYFIEYPQEIEDCIPADVMADLYMIKTQYWTMVKFGADTWFTNGRKTPLRYGDMVILKTTVQHDFSWISSEESQDKTEIPQAEYFSYEEQADYLPVYVEFDPSSDVQEIAITAGGEVKGAAVRETGDTLIEVNAYLEGVPVGTPMEFETYNGFKSTNVAKNEYVVLNQKNRKMEKRLIYPGEAVDAQLISFKHQEVFNIHSGIRNIICSPNTFKDETSIAFTTDRPSHVKVEILNLNGQNISSLINGEVAEGRYELSWDGTNKEGKKVNKGVYFYLITTENGERITDKIVIL